ncbi:protein kinase [Streptomyces sp. DSM 44915]|uniref:Protein kinase n=1 Tax=Streptomyces chisholmiae TaxID=3075540 RepID=A0ABU2JVM2_9ACTN|nr:protein kinase [Streptomyces sp. DSM 44915]MDT0268594.1 protein kinase [Streptomyces sp. DSM 44915]
MLESLPTGGPTRVGPYQLLARLGAGGMGEVYLARRDASATDQAPGLAAVKTLLPELGADPDFAARFRRETAMARAVVSPYTTALLDADPAADPPWLATEYVPGPSLHEAVARGGPLPVPVVRRLGVELARALAAVHGAGLVHRDVKPGNVLVAGDGARLIDFGIARAVDATALTATGLVVGSPGFMSPEQVRADTAPAAPSDVFCLGSVLCFAATGRSPFHDEEGAAVLLRTSRARADLTGVPEELRESLAACLRADPADRPRADELVELWAAPEPAADPAPWPAGVRELLDEHAGALARVLAAAPAPPSALDTVAAPAGPEVGPERAPAAARTSRFGSSRRTLALVGGAAAAAVLAGLVAGLLVFGDDDAAPDPAAGTGTDGEASAPPDGAASAPPEEEVPARSAEFFRTTFAYHPVTDETRPWVGFGAPADPEARPEGWAPWSAHLGGLPETCSVSDALVACLVTVDESRQLRVLSAVDGTELTRPAWQDQSTFTAPAVSGGDIFLVDGEDLVRVRAVDDTVETVFPGAPGYGPVRAVVDQGVVYVAYFGDAGSGTSFSMLFRAFRVEDGERLWEREVPGAYPQTMRLAGGRIVIDSGTSAGSVLDAETGEPLPETPETCGTWWTADEWVSCSYGGDAGRPVWDASSWEELWLSPGMEPVSSEHGVGIHLGGPVAEARGLRTGRELWTAPLDDFVNRPELLAAGEVLLASGYGQVDVYRLADGAPLAPPEMPAEWPGPARGGTAHDPIPLAHGGILHLFYQTGDVISTELPTP